MTGLLAVLGCTLGDGGFARVLCPLWSMLSLGGLLACMVARNPRLGRRIEHGPLGPGL